jgi:hypothetical protein
MRLTMASSILVSGTCSPRSTSQRRTQQPVRIKRVGQRKNGEHALWS